MEKIDIFFLALLVFGLIAMIRTEFPGITGNVVNECIDSDNGRDPYTGGNLIGFDESTKRDFCADQNTLYEYYCVNSRSNGAFEKFECFNGCAEENGKGVCLRARKTNEEDLKVGKCSNGCYSLGVCLPIGTRTKDGLFCGVDMELNWQLLSNTNCINNFECKSNLCIASKCVSEEVFNKFLESLT